MGGSAFGTDGLPPGVGSMDAATIADREREGGGAALSPAEGDASAARWRQWQLRNALTSRQDGKRARIAFTIIFAVLAGWFALQLGAPSLWS